jgi:hypothetical protein
MQRMSFVVGSAAILIAATAWGVTQNPQCVLDAKNEKQLCTQTCQDNFRAAKDLCWNVNHDCADACRAGRDTCVAPIYTALQTCIDGCKATLDTAEANCRALYAKGTSERDTCIDQAQVVAFSCRDTCRENLDRNGLKQCRKVFRSCLQACPPAN